MKKTLISLCMVFALCSCSDSDVTTFYALITITGSVLGIILFFKVWQMTNDVAAIREKIAPGFDYDNSNTRRTSTLTAPTEYTQDYAIGETVKTAEGQTGIVKDFYNGIYDVEIAGKSYTYKSSDLRKFVL